MTKSQQNTLRLLEMIRSAHTDNIALEPNHKAHGWFYQGPADLLLRAGRWYVTKGGQQIDWDDCIPNGCFRNAALYAMRHRLRYVEGYATAIIPVHHAWCIDPFGRVIEVSWSKLGTDYFGVEFNPKLVLRGSVLFHEPNARIYKRQLKGTNDRPCSAR